MLDANGSKRPVFGRSSMWIFDRVISFEGRIVSRDDFNDVSMPYGVVRPGDRSGNCYALTYRLESHYLLFLRDAAVVAEAENERPPVTEERKR